MSNPKRVRHPRRQRRSLTLDLPKYNDCDLPDDLVIVHSLSDVLSGGGLELILREHQDGQT